MKKLITLLEYACCILWSFPIELNGIVRSQEDWRKLRLSRLPVAWVNVTGKVKKKRSIITESQNHRMVGVGRDLCGSSSPTLLPKQGHLQQAKS